MENFRRAINQEIREAFSKIDRIYIADGHHRAASAVKVGLKRRSENPNNTGEEEYNFFLSVLFPHDQLMILPYNRAVRDLNGLSKAEFIQEAGKYFHIHKMGKEPYMPQEKLTFGMYLSDEWYVLRAKNELRKINDPVESLDVIPTARVICWDLFWEFVILVPTRELLLSEESGD